MTNPAAPLLSESEVSEIEARANAASQSYVVDWSKGEHALLQASGWRPANEEQPRTIATFDKEDGYLDLLFCAEARADIPALIRDWRALEAALDDLQIRFGAACEHVKIVEGECRAKDETIAALREQLEAIREEERAAERKRVLGVIKRVPATAAGADAFRKRLIEELYVEAAANESVTNEATLLEADNLLWINPVAGVVANHKAGAAFLPYRLVREDGDDG